MSISACRVVALVALLGACSSDAPRPGERPPAGGNADPDLVDIRQLAPSIRTDIRYAGSENFVGEPVEGYEAARCLLVRPAAEALAGIQARLESRAMGLLVYDCFRPQRAVDHFVRWAADTTDTRTKADYYPNVPKSRLFEEGYIAERSGHSRGATVDLTIVQLQEDAAIPLDMGSPWDYLDPRSHTESPDVTEGQLANRLRLREAMEAEGFRNYEAEWWHYTLVDEPYPETYFDVPIR